MVENLEGKIEKGALYALAGLVLASFSIPAVKGYCDNKGLDFNLDASIYAFYGSGLTGAALGFLSAPKTKNEYKTALVRAPLGTAVGAIGSAALGVLGYITGSFAGLHM